METRLLASELLVKYGVLWSQLAAEIEAFQIHLVTSIFGDGTMASGKAECWVVVLTMARVIWRDMSKFRFGKYTEYGFETLSVMVSQYIWGTI